MSSPDRALPPLRQTIERHGLTAKKSLGQHFLLDANLTGKIVRAAGNLKGVQVIEVGPGPGGLTRSLLESDAAHVFAIEKDERCIAALEELGARHPSRLTVLKADALEFPYLSAVPAPRAVVANLPYNVGTPLLLGWLGDIAHEGASSYRSLTLMFQKEVAERICAAPGSKDYGRLSVMTQWLCSADRMFDLPARAFTPPPKVDSCVVRLVPRAAPLYPADAKTLEAVVKAAFGQRRKMLRAALKSLRPDSESWLKAAGIDPTSRAETISIEGFCALARTFANRTDT